MLATRQFDQNPVPARRHRSHRYKPLWLAGALAVCLLPAGPESMGAVAAPSTSVAPASAAPLSGPAVLPTPPARSVLEAQQVDERLRTLFARAESLFRSVDLEQAFLPLSQVISALEPAAEQDRLDAEGRILLIRSRAYRADVNLQQGERDDADGDLEQLIRFDPRVSLDEFQLSDGVMDRFRRAQERLLGTLTFVLAPLSARVRVDGEPAPEGVTVFTVLAGDHFVEASLPGFTRPYEEVSVRAGRNADVTMTLHRISAVVKLLTRPPGASVMIDGIVVGETSGVAPRDWTPRGEAARYPHQEFSGELVIENLMPGEHEVEVFLEGYRSFRAPLAIPDLGDYHVGGVVLTRNLGLVLLRDLPPDADVWVDGRRAQPEPPSRASAEESGEELASTAYRLALPPGQYRITVSEPGAGVFEERVVVADRRNQAVSIRLRPGLTFLGVVGGDRLGSEQMKTAVSESFADTVYWAFLDRGEEAARVLQRAGVTADRLRSAAAGDAARAQRIDWSRVQSILGRELPGSIFLLGVLASGDLATEGDLWILPGAPGPPVPERVRVSLADRSDIESTAARLSDEMVFSAGWLGVELIDSAAASAPVVVGVAPDGPADRARVRVGDELVTVAGNSAGTAANARDWLAAFPAGSTVALELRSADGTRTVDVRMATTPVIVWPADPDRLFSIVWGRATAAVGRLDAPIASWVAELNQAAVLLHVRDWEGASRLVREIQAPSGPGVGQGLVDYWLGIALAELGDTDGARAAFERVLADPEARYLRNDGPYLGPKARARLYLLDSSGR